MVYYESRKRELKKRLVNECRCDESLKAKLEESSTRLLNEFVKFLHTNLEKRVWGRVWYGDHRYDDRSQSCDHSLDARGSACSAFAGKANPIPLVTLWFRHSLCKGSSFDEQEHVKYYGLDTFSSYEIQSIKSACCVWSAPCLKMLK